MQDYTTTDLAQFGWRERNMAKNLLIAWEDQGLPEDFDNADVTIMFNMSSGCVFLTNSDYQVAMMNGDKLESFYTCPECGHEGFKEDMNHEGTADCERFLVEIGVREETDENSHPDES